MANLKKLTLVEVSLTNGTQDYTFGAQQILAGRRITGIIVSPGSGKNKKDKDIADPTSAYIVLRDRNNNIIIDAPARVLQFTAGSPLLNILPAEIEEIDWTKSELSFASSISLTTGNVFQMTVMYE